MAVNGAMVDVGTGTEPLETSNTQGVALSRSMIHDPWPTIHTVHTAFVSCNSLPLLLCPLADHAFFFSCPMCVCGYADMRYASRVEFVVQLLKNNVLPTSRPLVSLPPPPAPCSLPPAHHTAPAFYHSHVVFTVFANRPLF